MRSRTEPEPCCSCFSPPGICDAAKAVRRPRPYHYRPIRRTKEFEDFRRSLHRRDFMTRFSTFTAMSVVACGLCFGAPRPETSTYVDGNVTSLKPNTGGTLGV